MTKPDRVAEIAEIFRERIKSGEWAPEQPIPSENTLAEEFEVSRSPIRNALATLRGEGLLRSQQGGRHYVRGPRRRVIRDASERYPAEKLAVRRPEVERRQDGSVERDLGLPIGATEFRAEIDSIPAPPDLAAAFGVPEGTVLLRRRYWQAAPDEPPMRDNSSYLIYRTVEANPAIADPANEPWPGGTQHQLWTLGIEVDRIRDEVTARQPTAEEAERLGMDRGVPVLVIRKVSISTSGNVVEVADVVSSGDRTMLVYTIQLPRWDRS